MRKTLRKSDTKTLEGAMRQAGLGRSVRGRLLQSLTERARRDGRAAGSVERALARAIRRAGLKWDTVSKKLRGERRMTEGDVRLLAAAIGENAEWLATGHGPHGEMWIRQRFEAFARSRGSSLPSLPDRPVAAVQRATSKRRGRPTKAKRLGPRVTGSRPARLRGPYRRPYKTFPCDPTEREDCIQWLARNPDILDEWIGRELDQGPRKDVLSLLLRGAETSVSRARDAESANNRRALVRQVRQVISGAQ